MHMHMHVIFSEGPCIRCTPDKPVHAPSELFTDIMHLLPITEYSLTSGLQAPAKEETLQVFERMKDMGVLIGKGGLLGNVFRIKPPMCITEQDADFLLEVMDIALSEL